MKGIAVFQNKLKGYVTFIQDDSKALLKLMAILVIYLQVNTDFMYISTEIY